MFDYVRVELPCRKCETPIKVWQSKDAYCDMGTVEVDRVQEFYASCHKCGAWNQYERRASAAPIKDPQQFVSEHFVYCGEEQEAA